MRGESVSATIARSLARRESTSGNSPRRQAARSVSTYSRESSAPASARMSASSRSDSTPSSTGPIPRAIAPTFMKSSSRVLERPAFRREKKAPRDFSLGSLKEGAPRAAAASGGELDGDGLGDPGLLHGDPVEDVRQLHRPLVVRDEEELVPGGHLADHGVEPVDVGVVQRGVHLVQQAEGGRVDQEDREDEADGGQCALPAGECVEGERFLSRKLY